MDAKFADHCQIGRHFGRAKWWNNNGFAADKNVECTGVKDDPAFVGMHLFPVFGGVVVIEFRKINDTGVRFGAVSDKRACRGLQIDGKAKPFGNCGGARDDGRLGMQRAQGVIVDDGFAAAKDDLVEHLAWLGDDGKRPRANLDVKRACVSFGHAVEFFAMVSDNARQQIKPTDRRLGRSRGGHALGQGHGFHQGDNIDAAFFQNGAAVQRNFVHHEVGQAVSNGAVAARKERCADAVSH